MLVALEEELELLSDLVVPFITVNEMIISELETAFPSELIADAIIFI
jgi:hypothetical protein